MIGSVTHASRHANGTVRRINERKIRLTAPPQMGLCPILPLGRWRGPFAPLRSLAGAVRALSSSLGADYSSLLRPGGVGKSAVIRAGLQGRRPYQEAVPYGSRRRVGR